jgi:Skp family chaperone for outer membrane proteins
MRKQARIGIGGLVLALAAGLFFTETRAQDPASTPAAADCGCTAVIDIVRVFNEFKQTQDINAEFETRRREVQAEVDGRDRVIETQTRELEAFAADSTDYTTRRRELMRLRIDRDNYMKLAEFEVRDLFRVWTRKTYDRICDVAAQVAEQRGFDIVVIREDLEPDIPDANTLKQQIRLRKVIYSTPRVDITEDVLSRINSDYETKAKKPDLGPIGN